jgi:hypothetical protein
MVLSEFPIYEGMKRCNFSVPRHVYSIGYPHQQNFREINNEQSGS